MRLLLLLSTLIVSATVHALQESSGEKHEALSKTEQETLLNQRVEPLIATNFDATCSFFYAMNSVAIHTTSQTVNECKVVSPFPKGYKPTWRETFDTIARQTSSRWAYDPELTYWVFTPDKGDLPFSVKLAEGWQSKRRGNYLSCKPPAAPVGMDVYIFGAYSTELRAPEKRKTFFDGLRDTQAKRFMNRVAPELVFEEVPIKKLGDIEARYLEILPTKTGKNWRQWVFVAEGHCIMIVSSIDPAKDDELLPQAEAMIASFRITNPASGWFEKEKKGTGSKADEGE